MANVGDVVIRLRGDIAAFNRAMKGAQRTLKGVGDSAKKTGESLANIGSRITLGLSAPIAAVGAATTLTANSFQKEITKINTLVGIATEETQQWGEAVLSLGPATGKGPTELARAMFVITSAGARGALALETLENAAKASAVGLGDTAAVARTVTSAVQAYGDEVLGAERATEILVATVREGNLEASDLAGSLGRVIGIAAQVGVSFEDLGAFVATFTRLGVSAEESVTALRGLLAQIIKPSVQAKEAFAEVGISVQDLQKKIARDGLAATLIDLNDIFDGNAEKLAAIIPNIRALSGFLGTASRQGEQFTRISASITESQGILGDAFEKTAEGGAFAFEKFKARLESTAITMGQALVPAAMRLLDALTPLLDVVVKMTNAFTALPTELQTVALAIAGITAVVGPVIFIVGNLISAFGSIVTAIAPLVAGLGSVVAFLGPQGLIALGIVGTVAAVSTIVAAFNRWGKAADEVAGSVKRLGKAEIEQGIIDATDRVEELNGEIRELQEELKFDPSKTARQRMNIQKDLTRLIKERVDTMRVLNDLADRGAALAAQERKDRAAGASGVPSASGAGAVAAEADAVKTAFEELDSAMTVARAKFDAFGGAEEALNAQLSAQVSAFEQLIAAGLDPTSARMQVIIGDVLDLRNELILLQGQGEEPVSAVQRVMDNLAESTRKARAEFQLLGDQQKLNSDLFNAQQTAMRNLIDLGMDPADERLQELATSIKSIDLKDTLGGFSGAFRGFASDVVSQSKTIGDAFVDLGKRILDTLIQIALNNAFGGGGQSGGGVFGQLLQAGFGLVGSFAGGFGFGGLNIASNLPTTRLGGLSSFGPLLPATAEGGIALTPQARIFGEAGPEAIIPLDRISEVMKKAGGGGAPNISVVMNGDVVDPAASRRSDKEILQVFINGIEYETGMRDAIGREMARRGGAR